MSRKQNAALLKKMTIDILVLFIFLSKTIIYYQYQETTVTPHTILSFVLCTIPKKRKSTYHQAYPNIRHIA